MLSGKVVYDNRTNAILSKMKGKVLLANRMLLEDIHRTANKTTPLLDGDLREQVTKRVQGNQGIIAWTVPYAQYQERGRRRNGSHVVRQYTTPGTGKGFAKKAVEEVVKTSNLKRYYK